MPIYLQFHFGLYAIPESRCPTCSLNTRRLDDIGISMHTLNEFQE